MAAVVCLTFWLGLPLPAGALTVSGSLTADTRWTVSQSPVVLQGQVSLDQNATLTIDPGVEIRMEPGASFTLLRGAVNALGTPGQPIVITSSRSAPAPGDWGVWRFTAGTRGAQTQWDNVRVEYGSGIVIEKSSPTLNRVAVRFHNGPAIRTDLESSPIGEGLSAEGNTLNAVLVSTGVISGSVTWGLVGIPYFVEQGLVEVGGSQLAIEPAEMQMVPYAMAPMRLVLKRPVPAGGRVVNFTSTAPYVAQAPASLNLPEGASEVDFDVISGSGFGTAEISTVHPELGAARAQVRVVDMPVISLSKSVYWMLTGGPYTMSAYSPVTAPAGGLTVRLESSPAGALQHPSSVVIPAGENRVEFVVQGNEPHTEAKLSAHAPGYFTRAAVTLPFMAQASVELDYVVDRIAVGEQLELPLMPSVPPPPRGGLRVEVASSDPGVLKVEPGETVLAAEELYPQSNPVVTYTGVSPGVARIQLGGARVAPNYRDIRVLKATVLRVESGSESGRITLGEGLTGKVRVGRQIDSDSYYGSDDMWVTLRCEDETICTGQSVYIPYGREFVEAAVTGGAMGTTQVFVEAPRAVSATANVDVVKPRLVWLAAWTDDYDHQISTARYMSERQGFRLCLSVPEAAPYNRQMLAGEAWVINLSLQDQAPPGLVSAIYDQPSGGSQVSEVRIENGRACTAPLYVAEATQRGRYRIGLDMANGTSSRSEPIRVLADHHIGMDPVCGDCSDLVVVQGFAAKAMVYAAYMGRRSYSEQPILAHLRCSDTSVCTVEPAVVEILPDERPYVDIIGLAPGEVVLEAAVPDMPDVYPDTGTVRIKVAPPSFSFDSEGWDTPVTGLAAGERGSYEICLSEPWWGMRSFPLEELQATLSSSNPAVIRPAQTEMYWPGGQECIGIEVEAVSAGSAQLTVGMPGVPAHTKRFEVGP